MSLADLRDGDRVFIDANIVTYHFGGRSLECKAMLERCARRTLLGYTSTPVLVEVLHRRMVAEAIAKGLVTAVAGLPGATRRRARGHRLSWAVPRRSWRPVGWVSRRRGSGRLSWAGAR